MATPLLIAHRGASLHAPENTMTAFERAVEYGADWIELDIQLSADGEALVFHDDDLDRLTRESGPVASRRAAELEQIEILDGRPGGGERPTIPTLAAVLESVGRRCPLYIELKSDGGGMNSPRNRGLLDRCVELLGEDHAHAVASFDVEIVQAAMVRGLRAVLIFDRVNAVEAMTQGERAGLHAFSARGDLLEKGTLKLARDAGSQLWLWTLDRPEQIQRALEAGVDGICSNDVPLARRLLDSWKT